MKRLFKLFKKERTIKNIVQKNMDNYHTATMTYLYFPEVEKEIKNREKVRRFFENLNTEC